MGYLDKALKWTEEHSTGMELLPTKIFSQVVNDTIWVVGSTMGMDTLIAQGTTEPIYLPEEIVRLRGKTPEMIRGIHMTKMVFPGSIITEGR